MVKKQPRTLISSGVIVAFIIGIFLGMELAPIEIIDRTVTIQQPSVSPIVGERTATMRLPAVNLQDEGVAAYLTVKIRPGNGDVFVNIDNVLANYDTQQSARLAANVAATHERFQTGNVDIIFDLMANASILEGPSAGAAMALTTVAAIRGQELRDEVMITGTINHDGSIGPAGRVDSKAKAASQAGADMFLVPVGEGQIVDYEEREHCQVFGMFDYCDLEIVPTRIDISDEAGISVIEVADLDEALEYML